MRALSFVALVLPTHRVTPAKAGGHPEVFLRAPKAEASQDGSRPAPGWHRVC